MHRNKKEQNAFSTFYILQHEYEWPQGPLYSIRAKKDIIFTGVKYMSRQALIVQTYINMSERAQWFLLINCFIIYTPKIVMVEFTGLVTIQHSNVVLPDTLGWTSPWYKHIAFFIAASVKLIRIRSCQLADSIDFNLEMHCVVTPAVCEM